MGEARRRKASDPFYGRMPKEGHGLIISAPSHMSGASYILETTALDLQELRHSLLFFDRLAYPINNLVRIELSGDAQFLEETGILSRPEIRFIGRSTSSDLGRVPGLALEQLNAKEPGCWSLGTGVNSLDTDDQAFRAEGGSYLELVNAIPVPDRDVPLADLLDFKLKRRDELLGLRITLAELMTSLEKAGDSEEALRLQLKAVDEGCTAVLKAAKESGFPLRLSDTKLTYSIQLATIGGAAFATLLAADYVPASLTAAGATLLGIAKDAVTIKIGGDMKWRRKDLSTFPFRYVASIHNELYR